MNSTERRHQMTERGVESGLGHDAHLERCKITEEGTLLGAAQRQAFGLEPGEIAPERMTLVVGELELTPAIDPGFSRECRPVPERERPRQGTHASALQRFARRWRPRGRAPSVMPSRRAAAHL